MEDDKEIDNQNDSDLDEGICQTCGGTGFVRAIGPVYANEPHMADVDEEPCPECTPEDDTDMDDDS